MSDSKVPSWVMLFADPDYSGQHLTRLYSDGNVDDMNNVKSDSGQKGFNDKVSSVMYCFAVGVTCWLYEHPGYRGNYRVLKGTGQLEKEDIKAQGFNDKTSSIKWEG